MALALLHFTDATPTEASAAITDGGDDGGIDCVYVSQRQNKLYLGQSKFSKNSDKGVELADFNRFRDGVRAVLDQKWTKTNKGLHKFKEIIGRLLEEYRHHSLHDFGAF